jgi:inorganic pyrophosphatase
MSLSKVTPGKNAPDTFNVIIEIPMNADPVKYEVDKESGAIFVDRFMSTKTVKCWLCRPTRSCRSTPSGKNPKT